jgi:hypothetical protein
MDAASAVVGLTSSTKAKPSIKLDAIKRRSWTRIKSSMKWFAGVAYDSDGTKNDNAAWLYSGLAPTSGYGQARFAAVVRQSVDFGRAELARPRNPAAGSHSRASFQSVT